MNRKSLHALSDFKNTSAIKSILSKYFGSDTSAILDNSVLEFLQKNEVLFHRGETGGEMYILLNGSLEAHLETEGRNEVLGIISSGECVGEMALLQDGVRSTSITARRESVLLKIGKKEFDQLSAMNPLLQLHLNKIIIERLKRQNEKTEPTKIRSKFIAFFPLDEGVSTNTYSEAFVRYWRESKRITVLQEGDFEYKSKLDFFLKINELESNDYVIMPCTGHGDWSSMCMNNADKVVYFAKGDNNILISNDIASSLIHRDELILAFDSAPKDIAGYFKYFQPNKIFRHQVKNKQHQDRIIRIISETAICLVLGGGGAHGLANLGVLKALLEHNIPIDIVGGSSVGSIFAATIAQDWEYEYIYQNIDYHLSKKNPLNDYTLPIVALLKGKKMKKMLRKHFDLPMEDLWKNMFAVASNLSTSKTEIIQSGALDVAIAASISIPGILPPVLFKQGLLIDGGVLNNLPSDIMKSLYNGYIISVDVVTPKERTIEHEYPLSNRQFIKNTVTGKKRNYVPGTMNTILKSVTLASIERSPEKKRHSHIYLTPRINKGFLAWKAIKSFEDEGYNTTQSQLREMDYKNMLELP